jgi:glycosyltransferase involved in cell wall biosynthesis
VKVCIDATPLGTRTNDKGGVYRYIWKLVESISSIDHDNTYILFFNFFRKQHYPVFRKTVEKLRTGNNFRVKLSRYPVRLQQFINPPAELLAGGFDIFHGCFDYLRPLLHGKGIVTIHDIRYLESDTYEEDPEWVDIVRRSAPSPELFVSDCLSRKNLFTHLKSNIMKTVQRADSVITVSEFSRTRIIEKLGVPADKVRVIYPGVDETFVRQDEEAIQDVRMKFGIRKRYILYVGKFEPQKNIIRLLEAFKKVVNNEEVCLVMAGPVNWYYFIVVEKLKQLGISESVMFTDFIEDEDMAALYSGASAFVFPSLYEGFGLPLLEAMACGVPIVTSHVCSIPEVVDDSAYFADPSSADDIADKVMRCLTDDEQRRNLIHAARKRSQSFSWKNTALKTIDAYKSI